MRPEGPAEADVNALVKARKYIKEIPRVGSEPSQFRMKGMVYTVEDRQPTGVMMMATVKKSVPGVPSPIPTAALEYGGRFRIRGINYAVRHDCPSGPIVYGWHEHVWTNQYEDQVVIAARPIPKNKT